MAIETPSNQPDTALAVLRELVGLQQWKVKHGKGDSYERARVAAWARADAVLATAGQPASIPDLTARDADVVDQLTSLGKNVEAVFADYTVLGVGVPAADREEFERSVDLLLGRGILPLNIEEPAMESRIRDAVRAWSGVWPASDDGRMTFGSLLITKAKFESMVPTVFSRLPEIKHV